MSSSGSDGGDGQEVGLEDVEVSVEPGPSLPSRQPSRLPPPLPPSAFAPTAAPPPPARSALFYVVVVLGVLVASVAVGTVVATRFRKAPAATAPSSAGAAPRVITIPVVDMNEPVDAGP